eukprot:m.338968 g.338968  ORF g.338968 m.338968 type:complete len:382 (+) comp18612_c0_seq1:72-1217(+)
METAASAGIAAPGKRRVPSQWGADKYEEDDDVIFIEETAVKSHAGKKRRIKLDGDDDVVFLGESKTAGRRQVDHDVIFVSSGKERTTPDETKSVFCGRLKRCGHRCCGAKDEPREHCLPCLQIGCKENSKQNLTQSGNDDCPCCLEPFKDAPTIKLPCNHLVHSECAIQMLKSKWAGPRIDFNFAKCPTCRARLLDHTSHHPSIQPYLRRVRRIFQEVKRKSYLRWQHENGALSSNPDADAIEAMDKYAYYMCYRCKKPYFGGEEDCAAAMENTFDPKDLVCGACVGMAGQKSCPKHGKEFLEYKCRWCCSVATFLCGSIHYCNKCHSIIPGKRIQAKFPRCPAGPGFKQLTGPCPLGVDHTPTGTEFALGCGMCRNTQTF